MEVNEIIEQLKEENTIFNRLSPIPEWFVEELNQRDLRIKELSQLNEVMEQTIIESSPTTQAEDQLIQLMQITMTYVSPPDILTEALRLLNEIKELEK